MPPEYFLLNKNRLRVFAEIGGPIAKRFNRWTVNCKCKNCNIVLCKKWSVKHVLFSADWQNCVWTVHTCILMIAACCMPTQPSIPPGLGPVWGRGTPLPPCPFTSLFFFPFFTFFFLSLALPIFFFFSSFVHPFPFYQNSPTPFPGRRS